MYFESLAELEHLPLFLTDGTDQLSQEIQANCVCLSMPGELQIKSQELLDSLYRVKHDRQIQLRDSGLKINLIYYIWHDEMAGQLRFNFINSFHQNLPFSCTISLAANEAEIVNDFLNSNCLQAIPWKELTAIESEMMNEADNSLIKTFTCKVYQEMILPCFLTLE